MEGFSEGDINNNEREQSISFESEGRKIAGKLFSPEKLGEKGPGVLILTGWRSSQTSYMEMGKKLAESGLTCLTFDFSGHGDSEGDIEALSRKNFLNDAISAYDFLSRIETVDPAQISAVGASFGAYIAAILSEKRSLKSLAFRAPADYPDEGFETPGIPTSDIPAIAEWRSQVRDHNDTESLKGIHQFTGNLLVVESGKDTVVPHETIQSYINAASDPKKVSHIIMEDAPHSLSGSPEMKAQYEKNILGWFSDKNGTSEPILP